MKRSTTGVLESKDDWLWGVSNQSGFQTMDALLQEFEGHNVRITIEDIREPKERAGDCLRMGMAAPI